MFEVFGGVVTHAGEIVHGKTSQMTHDGRGCFAGVPSPFAAVRYHSLAGRADTLPACLEVTCTTANGIIQGVRHRTLNIEGVQVSCGAVRGGRLPKHRGPWTSAYCCGT
jgi:anthranilate/para-aminobenzoate synthase component II